MNRGLRATRNRGKVTLRPDEAALGVSYDAIDDFLEGREIAPASAEAILQTYRHTAHKRALPAVPAYQRAA